MVVGPFLICVVEGFEANVSRMQHSFDDRKFKSFIFGFIIRYLNFNVSMSTNNGTY